MSDDPFIDRVFDPSYPGNDAAINTHRRYCLRRIQQANDFDAWEVAAVFKAKQDSSGAILLPQDFPTLDGRVDNPILSKLNAARYTTFEDLDGTNAVELTTQAGLTLPEASATLAGIAALRERIKTMGYKKGNNPPTPNQYANTLDLGYGNAAPLVPTTTVASSGTVNGSAFELGDRGTLRATITATAVTGGDSLAAKIQTGPDGVTWSDVASWTATTGVGSIRKVFTGLDRFVRVVATLTGTSTTFAVTGEAC